MSVSTLVVRQRSAGFTSLNCIIAKIFSGIGDETIACVELRWRDAHQLFTRSDEMCLIVEAVKVRQRSKSSFTGAMNQALTNLTKANGIHELLGT